LEQLYEVRREKWGSDRFCLQHSYFIQSGNTDTAKKPLQRRYREKEVLLKSKSTSRLMGGQSQNNNQSISWNESLQKKCRWWTKFCSSPETVCNYMDPTAVPAARGQFLRADYTIPKTDLQQQRTSEALQRDAEVRFRLESRCNASLDSLQPRDHALRSRTDAASGMPVAFPSNRRCRQLQAEIYDSDPLDSVTGKTGRSGQVLPLTVIQHLANV